MHSRRSFLVRSLGSLFFLELALSQEAQSRPKILQLAKKPPMTSTAGPHSLSKQVWPPAITPDFVDVDKRGFLCFADQFGRFSLVDLKRAASGKGEPRVMAELSGIGKRVVAMRATGTWAYALTRDSSEAGDSKFYLAAIDLKNPNQPNVVSQTLLDKLQDANVLIVDKDVVFVAGRSHSAENLVLVYTPPGKKGQAQPTLLSSITSKLPVVALDYQKRQLIVQQTEENRTVLDIYNASQLISPQPQSSLEVKGSYNTLTRMGDLLVLSGASDIPGKLQATSIALRPAPHAVSTAQFDSIEQIFSVSGQKNEYFVLGRDSAGKLTLTTVAIDKLNNLISYKSVEVPLARGQSAERGNLLVNGQQLYVASGWSGVQVLSSRSGQWAPSYVYKIPHLAAAGIASWNDRVVIVGAELMLYTISDPARPQLMQSAPLTSPIRAIVGAGSFILCLEKDTVTLRKMEQLDRIVATAQVSGRSITFDKVQHKAYVIQPMGKLTRICPLKVFSDNLDVGGATDVNGNFTSAQAAGGMLLMSDISGIALFNMDANGQEVGRRKFDNLAIRDICITDHNVLATAIDKNQKGFLLVLSKTDKELNIEGTIDLPHNGIALSASNTRAVAVGQDPSGKDKLCVIDITNSAAPTIKATFDVLESASVINVQSKLAVIGGRGLEIVSLG